MNLQKNVPLKNYSSYQIGGPARLFAEVNSVDELKAALNAAKNENVFILGGGTKILIDDKGFEGLVILNKIKGIEKKGKELIVGSGVLTKDLLEYCIQNSLSGLEWAGGLPGTVGGGVRGNAGAFGGETGNNVIKVESLNLDNLSIKIRNNIECQFTYRNSIFKSGEGRAEFITQVIFKLNLGDKNKIKEIIQQKIDFRRNNRHQMDYPSAGSVFKNVPLNSLPDSLQKDLASFIKTDPFPIVPATKLLAACNLKGKRVGGAMIFNENPNFIVNIDNATSNDIKALIQIAKQAVKEKYNISLKEEVVYLN